jgi:hypothetical protein
MSAFFCGYIVFLIFLARLAVQLLLLIFLAIQFLILSACIGVPFD